MGALYAVTLGFDLVYEDRHVLPVTNAAASFVRGAIYLSFWLTGSGWVAHAGNIALHLAVGGVVYGIARTVLGDRQAPWAALAAAVVWIHPLQVESVAYLQGRGDQLIALSALVAIWALIQPVVRPWHWGLVCAGVAVSLWTKEFGFTTLLIVVWTIWCRRAHRLGDASTTGVLAVAVLSTWWAIDRASDQILDRAWLSGVSLWEYAGWQAVAWWQMIGLGTVWPFRLSVVYDVQSTPGLVSVAAVLGLWALVVVAGRTCRTVAGWALGVALLSVLPRFLLRQEELLHEKHLYLAVAALGIAAAAIVANASDKDGPP